MADPQLLNRYSYVRNNPASVADPDGHNPLIFGALAVGGLIVSYLTTAPTANAPGLGEGTVARDYLEQDRAMYGVTLEDVRGGNWDIVAVGTLYYVPGGRALGQARALIPGIRALAESRALQGSVLRLTSALDRGAPGAVFQAERTLHYASEIVGMEFRQLFGEEIGYLDIVLTGNRVVDPKNWTGWAGHTISEQVEMLGQLTRQAGKYLSDPAYTLRFEFKDHIADDILETLNDLKSRYGERLTWEVIN